MSMGRQRPLSHKLLPGGRGMSRRFVLFGSLAVGIMGALFVLTSRASTPAVALEAELGNTSGVAIVNNPAASGNKLVRFGTPLAPPAHLRAFTGGDSIAVMWDATNFNVPFNYELYRDGVRVATLAPTRTSHYHTFEGSRYYDKAVAAGKTYKYQVLQNVPGFYKSDLSAPISVTQPTASNGVPSVTVDTSAAPDLAAYAALGKAEIQTWYPKAAFALTWGGYPPPTALKIVYQNNSPSTAVGMAIGTTVYMDITYARAHQDDLGIFIHETMHVMQSYTTPVSHGFVEGMPAWVTNNMFHDNDRRAPAPTATFDSGYDDTGYFLKWVEDNYKKPNMVHDLNVAAHNGVYSDALFAQQTGKTVAQLWAEMMAQHAGITGYMVGPAGKCADVYNANSANGTRLQLLPCRANNPAQTFTYVASPVNTTSGALKVLSKCMEAATSGTANGTPVQLWDCNRTPTQEWSFRSDGSLVNLNAGKCLQPAGGASADYSLLEISACNGSAGQKWRLPAP